MESTSQWYVAEARFFLSLVKRLINVLLLASLYDFLDREICLQAQLFLLPMNEDGGKGLPKLDSPDLISKLKWQWTILPQQQLLLGTFPSLWSLI